VNKSPQFKVKTPLDLVRPRSCYSFYKLLIDNTSHFWYRIGYDVVLTFRFFICVLFLFFLEFVNASNGVLCIQHLQ
jgi:hypothetical protein